MEETAELSGKEDAAGLMVPGCIDTFVRGFADRCNRAETWLARKSLAAAEMIIALARESKKT